MTTATCRNESHPYFQIVEGVRFGAKPLPANAIPTVQADKVLRTMAALSERKGKAPQRRLLASELGISEKSLRGHLIALESIGFCEDTTVTEKGWGYLLGEGK